MDDLASRLRGAFNARDIDAFRDLLAEEATWGDDPEAPTFCGSRAAVIAHVKQLLDEGVKAMMVQTTTGPQGVACVLDVEWPQQEAFHQERHTIYQSYRVADGRVIEIHGHDDHDSAVAAVSN